MSVSRDPSDKPRRLEEDTISYLAQIDKTLDEVLSAGSEEDLDVLVSNVLEEIKNRTASAACDRNVNIIIEKICLNSSFVNIIEILKRFTPYALFLSRNRHSSHIIQVCLLAYSSTRCDCLCSVPLLDSVTC